MLYSILYFKNFKFSLKDLKEEERIRFIKKCKNFKERLFKENTFDESITVNGKTSLMTINLQLLNDSLNELVEKTIYSC